ncbi:MAG: hydantoinase/oxoprolinase family protein [Desulfobacteraceae bacterium]|nr:hydantoinase/oxoprolinase family protein [Desulfobacteraceae bacterium]
MYKVCVDTGGTFTDCVVLDDQGRKEEFKSPSTPEDFSIGVVNSISDAASAFSLTDEQFLDQTELIIHGTTAATNAVVTKNVAKTALIGTKGFRDVIEIRRSSKIETHSMYEAFIPPYEPLVPRYLRFGVNEKTKSSGEITKGINEDEILEIIEQLKKEQIEAVAVCFINSFANPENEKTVATILEKHLDNVFVSCSSEILPKIGEYERTSTCVINASLGPVIKKYLTRLETKLKNQGFQGQLLVMQANQYAQSVSAVIRKPAYLVGSGPAAAPAGSAYLGKFIGEENIVTADMGGTTLDSGMLSRGGVILKSGMWLNDDRLGIKVVEVSSIGAGGGSIAWFDSLGLLRIGPKSAGAEPGPVCYGRGGTEPTVTDAAVILGYVPDDYFWGGKYKLDKEGARNSIKKIADKLGLGVEETAQAIFTTVSSTMADGITEITTRRGHDVRDFSLLVCGGAGAMCGAFMGGLLNTKNIIVPKFAASFCAWSMFCMDVGRDYIRTYFSNLDEADEDEINRLYQEMIDEALAEFSVLNVSRENLSLVKSVDLRYSGQFHEIELTLPSSDISKQDLINLKDDFHRKHNDLFTFSLPNVDIETRNLRLIATVKSDVSDLPEIEKTTGKAEAYEKRRRQCFFEGKFMDTPIYDGPLLKAGTCIKGHAIIEEPTTTVVIPPDFTCNVDQYGNYILNKEVQ